MSKISPSKTAAYAVIASLAIGLSACGGGGTSAEGGGTASSLFTNSVSVGSKTVPAGSSTSLSARVVMRGDTPNKMSWVATPVGALNPDDPYPLFGDINCAAATYAPPVVANASGEGACQTILTFPPKAKAGTWKIINTASSENGASVSNSVDVTVVPLADGGFRLLESSTPITGYAGKPLTLNVPFTVNAGTTARNVKYFWQSAPENPSIAPIAGKTNSSATFTPITEGQYRFDVSVTADVNGFTETQNASVVATVYPPNYPDVIDAGLPLFTQPDQVVSLSGAILNRSESLTYLASWRQLAGVDGGPVRVKLLNENSTVASFVAPKEAGNYGFEFKVVKRQSDGTDMVTTAQTVVVVSQSVIPSFTVSAGSAQTAQLNTPVTLQSTLGSQASNPQIQYAYQWTQTSGPAVTLSNANSQSASFIPTAAGTYGFRITATATTSNGVSTVSADTQVLVQAGPTPAATTFALSATAGDAKTAAVNAVTQLLGSYTAQGNATGVSYAYSWTQVGALPAVVTLSGANSASASFIPTVAGTYNFQLTVTATLADGTTRTATATTQVVAGGAGTAFSVSAGDAQAVTINTAAIMAGTVETQGSFAGATFSYAWTQVGAAPAAVTLSNANALTASFVPTVAGTYTFELTVTSNNGGVVTTSTARTQVLATP